MTVKVIENHLRANLSNRLSLNQFFLNPYQRGCATAAGAAPGCQTIGLLANGFNGARVRQSADEGEVRPQRQPRDLRRALRARFRHGGDVAHAGHLRRPQHQPADGQHELARRLPFRERHQRRRRARAAVRRATALATPRLRQHAEHHGPDLQRGARRHRSAGSTRSCPAPDQRRRSRPRGAEAHGHAAARRRRRRREELPAGALDQLHLCGPGRRRLGAGDRRQPRLPQHGAGALADLQAGDDRGRSPGASPPATARPTCRTSSSRRSGVAGNNTDLKSQTNLGYDLAVGWQPAAAADLRGRRLLRVLPQRAASRSRPAPRR